MFERMFLHFFRKLIFTHFSVVFSKICLQNYIFPRCAIYHFDWSLSETILDYSNTVTKPTKRELKCCNNNLV